MQSLSSAHLAASRGRKQVAVALGAIAALTMGVPEAHARPVLQGSTRATTGIRYGCEGAYCVSFRAAGCPKAMAKARGVTTSIVDVSELGNEELTFTWRDATKALNNAGANLNSSLNFYVVDSCAYAPGEFRYPLLSVLTLTTEHPTQTMTIPVGSKWLIAETSYHATAARWSAS